MLLENGWQQIGLEEGCKDYRKAYADKVRHAIFAIRLWQTGSDWRIEVRCNPMVKGIACNHPVVFCHLPATKDELSMMIEAEDLAREDFTRLQDLCILALRCMD